MTRRPPGARAAEQASRIAAQLGAEAWVSTVPRVDVRSRRPVPVEVEHRVLRAAGEALRNVGQHAGVQQAELLVRLDRASLTVSVTDSGVGAAGTTSGWGTRHSILRPLAEVGATATVESGCSGGTQVTITWPRPRPRSLGSKMAETHAATLHGLQAHGLLHWVAFPPLAAYLVLAAWLGSDEDAWPVLAIVAAAQATALLLVTRILAKRALRPVELTLLCAAQLITTTTGLTALPDGALRSYESWMVGLGALPLLVSAFTLPTAALVPALMSGVGVVTLEVVADPVATWTASLGAYVGVLLPVYAFVLGAVQRRTAARADAERAAHQATMVELERAERLHAQTHAQLRFTQQLVLPWLDEVARGDRSLDAETRQTARLLAAEARDDLCAPGFYDDDLRRRVRLFRASGGSVTIDAGFPPGAHLRPIGRLLSALVEVDGVRRIVVRPRAGTARCLVEPPCNGVDLARLSEHVTAGAVLSASSDDLGSVFELVDPPDARAGAPGADVGRTAP